MSIVKQVSSQMKDAMRAKDKPRLAALRGMRTVFLNEMKKDNSEDLSDEVCIALLRRLAKQHVESIEAFEKGGRPAQADEERAELVVIEAFLPKLADLEQTSAWVREAIALVGACKPGDLGRVMGALMKARKGEIDGVLAKKIAGELLGG